MNSKVTFPELVDAVAAATECPKRMSELFLKELFTAISDALRNGESVRVRGLGLFKLTNVEARKSVNVNTGEEMEIPSHRKVSFVPEKALADAINAPFAGFETVVLDDNLSEEELLRMASVDDFDEDVVAEQPNVGVVEQPKEPESEQPIATDAELRNVTVAEQPNVPVAVQPDELPDDYKPMVAVDDKKDDILPTDEDMKEELPLGEDKNIVPLGNEVLPPEPEDYNIPEDDDEEFVGNDKSGSNAKNDAGFTRGFIWGALTMFVLYLVAGGGYYMYQHIQNQEIIDTARGTDSLDADAGAVEEMELADSEAGEAADPVAAQATETVKPAQEPAKPAVESKVAEPVYDTVTEKQFLTKIAYKHYGNSDFWVYIFEENRSIIRNPNTIAPGTKVVIPPAEKYGIDKNNPESLKAARKKIQEIELAKK